VTDPADDTPWTENPQPDVDPDQVLTLDNPLHLARQYLTNARAIGQPGQPTITDAAPLQAAHARMAQTAALIAIAEELHTTTQATRTNAKRLATVSNDLHQLAKDIARIRQGR
jgi:hypothetical protein